jgi:hypothetical protein
VVATKALLLHLDRCVCFYIPQERVLSEQQHMQPNQCVTAANVSCSCECECCVSRCKRCFTEQETFCSFSLAMYECWRLPLPEGATSLPLPYRGHTRMCLCESSKCAPLDHAIHSPSCSLCLLAAKIPTSDAPGASIDALRRPGHGRPGHRESSPTAP